MSAGSESRAARSRALARAAFAIAVDADDRSDRLAHGRITIGSFSERFEVVLTHWTRARYQHQWYEGLRRTLAGEPRSCLITSVSDPTTANFLVWWPIYTLEGCAVFQNQLLFLDELTGPFDESEPYRHIPPRETISPDGDPISEWRGSVEAIRRFLSERGERR